MDKFYQESLVNYSGVTSDTEEKYMEIIAAYLLEHMELFDQIKTTTRQSSYKTDSHKGVQDGDKETNRKEEWLAKKMFKQTYKHIGIIKDYQTPLKNSLQDKGLGKIDLIALENDTVSLIELKYKDNKETILRCILEIYTYFKTIDQKKLLKDFDFKKDSQIVPVVLIFKDSFQYKQLYDEKCPLLNVQKLMNALGVKVFLIEEIIKISIP